jgi:predicted nucleic acid-binding protein
MTSASTAEEILNFVRYLCQLAHQQEVYFLWRSFLRDPKDDMVLEAAIASASDYIITHNLRDFRSIDVFGIKAVTPAQFLARLEGMEHI